MKLQLITLQAMMLFTTIAEHEPEYEDPWAEFNPNFEAAVRGFSTEYFEDGKMYQLTTMA